MRRHLAVGANLAVAIAIFVQGCGPRDLDIVVTGKGMQSLLDACDHFNPNATCYLDGHPNISGDTLKNPLQARLFLSDSTGAIRASSACFELLPSAVSPTIDAGGWAAGMAGEINQALEGALPNGLTYSGLQDPSAAVLTLGIYQPTQFERQCDSSDLIACAGFEQPLSGGSYDVSCASCQGGDVEAIGSHCPAGSTSCFFQECAHVIATAN